MNDIYTAWHLEMLAIEIWNGSFDGSANPAWQDTDEGDRKSYRQLAYELLEESREQGFPNPE